MIHKVIHGHFGGKSTATLVEKTTATLVENPLVRSDRFSGSRRVRPVDISQVEQKHRAADAAIRNTPNGV